MPRRARSHLSALPNGHYLEPRSAVVSYDEEPISVVCVQRCRTTVLVRHMPEEEWKRICEDALVVQEGRAGVSSMHVVATPEYSTLPPSVLEKRQRVIVEMDLRLTDVEALEEEPWVYDYVVAPDHRGPGIREKKHSSVTNYWRHKAKYTPEQLQRIEREDRRAALSVERRRLFLKQFQRDLQCRMDGDPLYVVGRKVPDHMVQMFFLLNEQQHRHHHVSALTSSTGPRNGSSSAAPFLFTLGPDNTRWGDRLVFPGQSPADGYVVVTVGTTELPPPIAEDDGSESFEPYDYGTAVYVPRTERKDENAAQSISFRRETSVTPERGASYENNKEEIVDVDEVVAERSKTASGTVKTDPTSPPQLLTSVDWSTPPDNRKSAVNTPLGQRVKPGMSSFACSGIPPSPFISTSFWAPAAPTVHVPPPLRVSSKVAHRRRAGNSAQSQSPTTPPTVPAYRVHRPLRSGQREDTTPPTVRVA